MCFAVVVAARSVVALYRPILEPLGLTHPQYLVMLALWERAPQTASQLSHTLALDPGTLSPLLKRLAAAGLIERQRDSRDERQLAVRLTAQGMALRSAAEKVPGAVSERLGMGLDELAALRDDLNRVISAAGG
ncbi:MAG: MarR family transcriptional regulator [Nakamurella sp.]